MIIIAHLLVHVTRNLWCFGFSDLDVADVQIVDDLLHFFWRSPRSSRQSNHSEVRVICHEVGDALDVRVITRCFVRFIFKSGTTFALDIARSEIPIKLTDNNENNIHRIHSSSSHIVTERLWSGVKYSLISPLGYE